MKKLEEFIYSVKYLAPTLYFGSVGLLGYDFYCDIIKNTQFLNEYMTYLGVKKYQKK